MFKAKGVIIIASCMSTLKELNFRDNEITGAVDDIISMLLSNQEMEHLYLGDNVLQSGVSRIVIALKKCTSLRALDFDNNDIMGCTCTKVASVYCNGILEALYLQHNPGGMVIVQALNQISTITCLDLNDNNSRIAADQLATTFSKITSLEDL